MSEFELIPATRKQLAHAREVYDDTNVIDFDPDALVSQSVGGVWIQGWLWLPDDE